jgi:hypothetical protein
MPGLMIPKLSQNASHAVMLFERVVSILYTELVQAQPIRAPMSLDHTQLVKSFLACRRATANVPLLCAHGLVKAF